MKKTLSCFLLCLGLDFISVGQAADETLHPATDSVLPSVLPHPQEERSMQEKCLRDCNDKKGMIGNEQIQGVTCEQICGVKDAPGMIKDPKEGLKGFIQDSLTPGATQ